MKQSLYSVKDAKVGYGSPFYCENDAVAMRNFESTIMRSPSVLGTHSADFDLYRVGSFDTVSGKLEPLKAPEFIMAGFIAQAKNGGAKNGEE